MADVSLVKSSDAITFMVSAGLVYEIIAAACSSPQTTEINAGKRSATLMKWVHIGLAQAALFVFIAAWMDDETWPALLGGALAGVVMYASYVYAKRAGLANGGATTESY
jgi:uncharacterized membrane protein